MDKETIEQVAKTYMLQLGYCENTVAKLQIKYRNNRRRLGTCHRSSKKIIFSSRFFDKDDRFWMGLIAHEVAHFRVRNHNKRFREVLASINQDAVTIYGRRTYCSVQEAITAGLNQTFQEVI